MNTVYDFFKDFIEYEAICNTDNCYNKDITVKIKSHPTEPRIICGPCGNLINNIEVSING
jgi:hypothetical protein